MTDPNQLEPKKGTDLPRFVIVIIAIAVVALLIYMAMDISKGIARNRITPTPLPTIGWVTLDDRFKTWTVNHNTGMYAHADNFQAEQIGILYVGDTLSLPSGRKTLECKFISESGTWAQLCEYYSSSLRKTGWVIKNWVD